MYPKNRLVILATFAQNYQAKDVLFAIKTCRIIPTKEIISDSKNLIIELQGIKEVIQLESLFIESICRDQNMLTIDIFTTQKSCERLLQQFS